MKKESTRIGVGRRPAESKNGGGRVSGILFTLGVIAICTALILPMSRKEPPQPPVDAVSVMSLGTSEKEKLAEPEKIASAEPEWSIFEYIGELIAGLLSRGE